MSHALVIGGTGMMRDVSLYLACQGGQVSVVARTRKDLDTLEKEADGNLFGVSVDYGDRQKLDDALSSAIAERGNFDMIVAWIHDPVLPLAAHLADFASRDARYIHVRGSAAANPADTHASIRSEFNNGSLSYEEVILGYVIESGRSRWLTNGEIANGIIESIRFPKERTIVGVVRPWSARP